MVPHSSADPPINLLTGSVPEQSATANSAVIERTYIFGQDNGTPTGRDSVYASFHAQVFSFQQRMVRTRTHKLTYNYSDISELYDLAHDPWESRNLIDMPETEAVQDELLALMREHMVRLDDPILRAFDRIRHVY